MKRFEGKVVIVTGAASGIGEATARRFSSEGASVALVDRNEMPLAKVAKELPAQFTLAHLADVSDSEAVDAMVAPVVKRFGRLDVLVNNAGVFEGGDPAEITNEQRRKVMAIDLDGVFFGCRTALPHLQKTGGAIVNGVRNRGRRGNEPLQRRQGRCREPDALAGARPRQGGRAGKFRLSQPDPDRHDLRHDGGRGNVGEIPGANSTWTGL
jgi:NAD(P)-dependent dehydrogenase (short-subunit alcohol dehydrogenase family)